MKKFRFVCPFYLKGLNVRLAVVASTYKVAADLLGVSAYHLKTYGHRNEAEEFEFDFHTPMVLLERSGETPYIFTDDEIKTPIKKVYFERRLNEWRKKYPTYRDTLLALNPNHLK